MRIQIEMPAGDVNTLKTLMAEANIETYKDLFRNALLLLYWAVREVKNGRIIASVRAEEVDKSDISCKQIVMPILDRLVKATERSTDAVQTGKVEAFPTDVSLGDIEEPTMSGEAILQGMHKQRENIKIVAAEEPQAFIRGTTIEQLDEIRELIGTGQYAEADERLQRIRGIGIGKKVKP